MVRFSKGLVGNVRFVGNRLGSCTSISWRVGDGNWSWGSGRSSFSRSVACVVAVRRTCAWVLAVRLCEKRPRQPGWEISVRRSSRRACCGQCWWWKVGLDHLCSCLGDVCKCAVQTEKTRLTNGAVGRKDSLLSYIPTLDMQMLTTESFSSSLRFMNNFHFLTLRPYYDHYALREICMT